MRTPSVRRRGLTACAGAGVMAAVLACTCNLPSLLTPTPTPVPTYSAYPTYTPASPHPTVESTPTATATEPPPSPALPTKTPTLKPPTNTPTTTPTEAPPPPGGGSWGIVQSDLEITNIGPVSTTRADKVFVDLKNHGPREFSGKIRVVCVGYGYMRSNPAVLVPTGSDELIDITIGVGTGFFYPSMITDVPLYSYTPIQCIIEVPDNKDPNPNNNSYSIVIP